MHAPIGSVEQQVGDFFASAMDAQRLETLGIAPLQPEFERIQAIAAPADLASTIAHLLSLCGSPILLTPYVKADRKKSDVNALWIYPGGLSLGNRDLVSCVGELIDKRRPIVSVPSSIGYMVGWIISKLVNDVIITKEEIAGLMANLLYVDTPPAGSTKLTDWAKERANTLGLHYTSELVRRTDRYTAYQSN